MRTTTLLPIFTAVVLVSCGDDPVTVLSDVPGASLSQQHGAPIDIEGTWEYDETAFIVLKPEDEVLKVTCRLPGGTLTIDQDGATFTGTLVHESTTCQEEGGDILPPPWPLPYHAVLSGTVNGQSIHIDQFDAPPAFPVHCPKEGFIAVLGGEAVGLRTQGTCDLSHLPFPFRVRNTATGTRQ